MGNTLNKAFQTFPEAKFIVHNGDLTEDPEDSAGWDDFWQCAGLDFRDSVNAGNRQS